MANNLNNNIENIKEQSAAIMDAIEILKQQQYSQKTRQIVGWVIVTLVVIISTAYACQVNR